LSIPTKKKNQKKTENIRLGRLTPMDGHNSIGILSPMIAKWIAKKEISYELDWVIKRNHEKEEE